MRAVLTLLAVLLPNVGLAGDSAIHRKDALAVETVTLARDHCGHEVTARAGALIAADRRATGHPFAKSRDVLANLWRKTWACDPAFTGASCMAARLQLCQRAYAEYGPDGILAKGLIRAIIHK